MVSHRANTWEEAIAYEKELLAKLTKPNTLVIDIRDTDVISYESEILKEYSPTSYKRAYMTFEDYQTQIKKAKDAGLYLVDSIPQLSAIW